MEEEAAEELEEGDAQMEEAEKVQDEEVKEPDGAGGKVEASWDERI